MSLQNLNEVATKAQSDFDSYHKEEIVLSPEFKEEFSEILNRRTETIRYSQFTSVVETSSHLTITFPNQWFFIASYFIDYLIALKEYKRNYVQIFQGVTNAAEIVARSREDKVIPTAVISRIDSHFENSLDREYFKKFLSDYDWWFGSKTIDRSDFYISSILYLARAVNASQGYIADLTNYLSTKPSIINSLYKSEVSQINTIVQNLLTTSFNYSLFYNNALSANIKLNKDLGIRFTSSLLTKPFVILTGLSGSGKTKLAQAFAMWLCADETQYRIVPVGADWTNREPLLGFPNALNSNEYIKPDNGVLDLIIAANANADKPYFLILDEMNLSHVERYFADFLSVMESKEELHLHAKDEIVGIPKTLKLPPNLFIIGTVNIDETTYMFSPKVLDRASVIEFRVTAEEMEAYLNTNAALDLDSLKGAGSGMANSFISIAANKTLVANKPEDLKTAMLLFFNELKKTGAEFGYRSAAEIIRFAAVVNHIEADWNINQIIDAAIMQKLLPKVHGSRRKLEPVLKTLIAICLNANLNIDELIAGKTVIDFTDTAKYKYPLSLEKILRMYNGLINNGFTSYAEA